MTDAELQTVRERVEWYALAERVEGGEVLPECDRERMTELYRKYAGNRSAARHAVAALLAEVDRLRAYIDDLHNGQEPLMPDDEIPRQPLTEKERERILTDKTAELLDGARRAGEAAAIRSVAPHGGEDNLDGSEAVPRQPRRS